MSSTTQDPLATTKRSRSSATGLVISVALILVVAGAANAVIAGAAGAAGASSAAPGMIPAAYLMFTFLGGLVGGLGWLVVRRASTNPARLLKLAVPIVFALLLIPAVALAASAADSGAFTAAIALIVMHFATVGVAIPVYVRFLPLRLGGARD